jgi:hypothetical protein
MHQVACPDFSKSRNYQGNHRSHSFNTGTLHHNNVKFAHLFRKKTDTKNEPVSASLSQQEFQGEQISKTNTGSILPETESGFNNFSEEKENDPILIASSNEDVSKEIALNNIVRNKISGSDIPLPASRHSLNKKDESGSLSASGRSSSYGYSIVALVAGILAFFTGFSGAILFGVLAIVFGAISLRRGSAGRMMALIGLILGIVAIALILL